ncbi:hypothetical protein G7Y79_00040g076350 [Physcia stellaris]|nr:hypothetical protein G7Y79_00040g076350 [Physcia stellaris]
MSFGFGVSDFIAVGELAFKLYKDCYQVARGAPQDFKLLVNELSSLSNSIKIVREAVQDPGSILIQAGEERIRSVNGLEIGINDTLTRLEKIIKKYGALSSASTRKTFWAKFKWSMESRNIDGLRAKVKLVYHNTMMNLLLTSVGNSSLQRIEETHTALTRDIAAIKSFISGHQVENSPSVKSPALSVVDGDEVSGEHLNAAFMKNAEIDQPWSTIGIDRWVEAGRWWLMIAQMELLHISTSEHSVVPYFAYVSLIKSFWILMDVITCHPQLPFHTAGSQAEIRVLSSDMQIWAHSTRGSLLRPRWTSEQDIYPQIPSVTEPVTLSLDKAATNTILVDGELLTFRELSEAINFCFFEINTSNNDLRTVEAYVLIFAVKNECGDLITQLVKSKSLNEGGDERMSLISPSGVALSMISHYLESGPPQEIVASDFQSISPVSLLDWAVRRGQTALLALLLSENVPYQPPDLDFVFSMEERQSDQIAQLLLKHSLRNKLPQERCAIYKSWIRTTAAKDGHGLTAITRLLLCHVRTDDPIHEELCHEAFFLGVTGLHAELVRSLVSAGLNINARDKEGLSALMHVLGSSMYRVSTNPTQASTILLENGASTEEHGPRGESMRHLALIGGLDNKIIYPILSTEIQSRQQIQSVAPHIQWNMAEMWNKLISVKCSTWAYGINYRHPRTLSFNILFGDILSKSLNITVNLRTGIFPSIENIEKVSGPFSEPDISVKPDISVTAQVRNGGGFQVNLSRENPFHSFKVIPTDPNSAPESQVGEEETILEETIMSRDEPFKDITMTLDSESESEVEEEETTSEEDDYYDYTQIYEVPPLPDPF